MYRGKMDSTSGTDQSGLFWDKGKEVSDKNTQKCTSSVSNTRLRCSWETQLQVTQPYARPC